MRAWDPYVMQMGGAKQKHNAEGGREAKKFKNHCNRATPPPNIVLEHSCEAHVLVCF